MIGVPVSMLPLVACLAGNDYMQKKTDLAGLHDSLGVLSRGGVKADSHEVITAVAGFLARGSVLCKEDLFPHVDRARQVQLANQLREGVACYILPSTRGVVDLRRALDVELDEPSVLTLDQAVAQRVQKGERTVAKLDATGLSARLNGGGFSIRLLSVVLEVRVWMCVCVCVCVCVWLCLFLCALMDLYVPLRLGRRCTRATWHGLWAWTSREHPPMSCFVGPGQ